LTLGSGISLTATPNASGGLVTYGGAAGALTVATATTGTNTTQAASTAYDVANLHRYGQPNTLIPQCDTTGVTDCTSLIMADVDTLGAASGGLVLLPSGVVNVSTGLAFNLSTGEGGIEVKGQGWEDIKGGSGVNNVHGTLGTYLYTSNTSTPAITCGATSGNQQGCNQIVVDNLACIQNQPADTGSSWAPTVYPACIQNYGTSMRVEDVMFWGVYIGYQAGLDSDLSYASSRASLHHIYCAAFLYCFNIAGATDVLKVDDVHAYSYFLNNNPDELAWISNHGTAFRSGRDDNPMISNFFTFGYNQCFYFTHNLKTTPTNQAGWTSHGLMTNIGCDGFGSNSTSANSYNGNGIYIDGSNTELNIVNYYAQGNNNGASSVSLTVGISVAATDPATGSAITGVNLDADGIVISNTGANAINISNSGSGDYSFVNLRMHNYNLNYGAGTSSEFTGIFTGTGNTICITGRFQGYGLSTAAKTSGVTPTYGSCTY
jgi:hypothetical protein